MYVKVFNECEECKGTGKTKYKKFTVSCKECGGLGEIEGQRQLEELWKTMKQIALENGEKEKKYSTKDSEKSE
jgi:DnaJ-class molecular chaperone